MQWWQRRADIFKNSSGTDADSTGGRHAVRCSFSHLNTEDEVDAAIRAIWEISD